MAIENVQNVERSWRVVNIHTYINVIILV